MTFYGFKIEWIVKYLHYMTQYRLIVFPEFVGNGVIRLSEKYTFKDTTKISIQIVENS